MQLKLVLSHHVLKILSYRPKNRYIIRPEIEAVLSTQKKKKEKKKRKKILFKLHVLYYKVKFL